MKQQERFSLSALVESVSRQTGLPRDAVKSILTEFLGVMMRQVSENDRVVLRGFGSLFAREKKGRRYRNPRTGEVRTSAPGRIPTFLPSKVLLRALKPSTVVSVGKVERKGDDSSLLNRVSARTVPVRPGTGRRPLPKAPQREECEVILSVPNPRQTDDLRIAYTPSAVFDSAERYPVVYSPGNGSLLKLPRDGRSDSRGYKEADFLSAIREEFTDIAVSDDLHLKVPGRLAPYEPDIVLYDECLNLYIDVEIDEPYDGYSRLVTHITEGKDAIRDTFFKESGWVVVRFSEWQVHLQCKQCIRTLRNIVDVMRGAARPLASSVKGEKRWDRRQAVEWEKALYREKYLGIQAFSRQVHTRRIQCTDSDEGIDRAITRTPVHIPVEAFPPFSPVHPIAAEGPLHQVHPSALTFREGTHSYSMPGDDTGNTDRTSVTMLIEQFFPYFDEEAYIAKRMAETGKTEEEVRRELAEPSERGTDMHRQIECFLKGLPYRDSSKEFQLFERFHRDQIVRRGLVFDSAEYPIELKEANIAGTVDALFRKPDGEYVMVDWKRSRHLVIDGYPRKYGFGRGLSVLSHLDNSSYYKYELQQSFYKYILEKDYGIRVSSMILAVLHPDYDTYYAIRLDTYRKQEVLDMIESYSQTL